MLTRSHSGTGRRPTLYDVAKKADLEDAVAIVSRRIKNEFVAAFKGLYPDDRVPSDRSAIEPLVAAKSISCAADIGSVFRRAGFYIILTDYPVKDNQCHLTTGSLRAIYRGERAEVRLRVMSHLANTAYRQHVEQLADRYLQDAKNAEKQFYKNVWPHASSSKKGAQRN